MSVPRDIVQANVRLLEEATRVIRDLSDDDYARAPRESRGGGIGAQFRHVIDFYELLLAGVPEGRVDYDRRERSALLETDRAAALERLGALAARLGALSDVDRHHPLEVGVDREAGAAATWSRSTLDRELRFIQSHTIHHFALIGWMCRSLGLRVPDDFGLAPSTRRHWARLGTSL